jgi:hypothetical protein
MTPLLPLMGGCWRLPPLSSLTTAIKSSFTHAWTPSRIAGLGGSRRQSSTWIGFPTTFCPRASTSLSLLPLLLRWTPSALPLWWHTFSHQHQLFPKIWSPFPPLGAVSRDGPSLFWAAPVMGGLWGAFIHSTRPLHLPWYLPTLLGWLGPHLALLTHGGSAAALILNPASNSQAGLLLLALAVFPLQLIMGGIMAVRLLVHLPCHLLLLGFFMGGPLCSTTLSFGLAPTLAAPLFLHVGVLMRGLHSPPLLLVIVGGLPSPPLLLGLWGPWDLHLGCLFLGALLLWPFLRLSLVRSRMFHHWWHLL